MMNDPFVHEQAEVLAAARHLVDPNERLREMVQLVLVDHLHQKSKPFWSHSTPPTSLNLVQRQSLPVPELVP